MSNPVRFILFCLFSVMWAAVSMAGSMAAQAQPAPPAMPVTKVVKETLDAPPSSGSMGGPVVIELFTAKSCVFCPQADRLFAELAGQPGVIALACHVDYLKDGDALAQDFCMERQNWYMDRLHAGPNYTPQLIVNGSKDAVGYKTDIVTALVHQKRGDDIAPIGIRTLNVDKAGTQFAVTLPDGAIKESGRKDEVAAPGLLTGWQLAVTTFHKPVTPEAGGGPYVRVADNMQVLPLDRYKGPAFKLTVPLSDGEDGVVVVLQRQDTGRIAAAGQYLKEQVQPVR
jgi:hypothetical protein